MGTPEFVMGQVEVRVIGDPRVGGIRSGGSLVRLIPLACGI